MFLRSREAPGAGGGQARGRTPAAGEAMEPGAAACGSCKGVKLQKGVSGENPTSLLAGTGKSCLENWTRRRSWENLSAGARGGREGSQTSRVLGDFLFQPLWTSYIAA